MDNGTGHWDRSAQGCCRLGSVSNFFWGGGPRGDVARVVDFSVRGFQHSSRAYRHVGDACRNDV